MTNNNYNSKLSITFGDVYFANEGQYSATLSGAYVADDSYVLDFSTDASCTSLDLTAVTGMPSELTWLTGTNKVVYVGEDSPLTGTNIVAGTTCKSLILNRNGGDFRPAKTFTADEATLTIEGDGIYLFVSPFSVQIPPGYAFVINDDCTTTRMRSIPANKPILLDSTVKPTAPTRSETAMTIRGTGEIAPESCPVTAKVQYTYTATPIYPGDYVFGWNNGQAGFVRVTEATTLPPFSVYAQFDSTDDFIPLKGEDTGIEEITSSPFKGDRRGSEGIYNLQGQRISVNSESSALPKGIYIVNGQKIMVK